MGEHKLCFIDGQNLYIGTKLEEKAWDINFGKLRRYLSRKYKVKTAYYYLGYRNKINRNLYKKLIKQGFVLVFKEHTSIMISKKRGNIDSDIIFDVMKKICEKEDLDKIILISGDGDYIKLIKYLIEKNKFEKILFPNKKYASSLYKILTSKYFDYIINIKHIIKK